MNCAKKNKMGAQRGVTLLELIAYLAIFAIVIGLATEAFFKTWTSSKLFRTDSDQIARSVAAGEKWRADVRAATGAITSESADGSQTFRIPLTNGEVTYIFAQGRLKRQTAGGREVVVMSNVASSAMQMEQKDFGAICRWELELAANQRGKAVVRPLFSFAAVAANGGKP